jgi:hypothetical protein
MVGIAADPPPNLRNRRRSQRVELRIPLVLRTQLPDGRTLRVHVISLVANAHGGLLESPLMIQANHQIALVNPKTGQDAWCRVIREERSSTGTFNLAFEFREPQAKFWPMSFPPADWGTLTS